MAILNEDITRRVVEQRLGFFATVCEDGPPNLMRAAGSTLVDRVRP